MRRTWSIWFLSLALSSASAQQQELAQSKPAPLDWNPAGTSPRSRALELADDSKSQGYALRDGFWSGTVQKDQPVVLAVQLFAWNDYSFFAAHINPGSRIQISIFDRWGYKVGSNESSSEASATAGISAVRSDRYYIRLELTEGDKAETCMVYSYK
jgi:hypothetical protein